MEIADTTLTNRALCAIGRQIADAPPFFCSLNVMRIIPVGHHCGPVIPTSARIGSPGPGRFPYSFQMIQWGLLGEQITGNPHTNWPLINQSSCTSDIAEWTRTRDPLTLGNTSWPLDHGSQRLQVKLDCHRSLVVYVDWHQAIRNPSLRAAFMSADITLMFLIKDWQFVS
jgi:hypothetical protein